MKEFWNSRFFRENRDKIIRYSVIALVVVVGLTVFALSGQKDEVEPAVAGTGESTVKSENIEEQEGVIIVDVEGAVAAPQVVTLDEGARIKDAIDAAGGTTEDADLSGINQAAFLNDGDRLYIPKKGEEGAVTILSGTQASSDGSGAETGSASNGSTGSTSADATGSSKSSSSQKININTAGSEELQKITGVGPATAEKIMIYRATYGPFNAIEDIKNVEGIGDKTFEKMKDEITV